MFVEVLSSQQENPHIVAQLVAQLLHIFGPGHDELT